MAFLRWNREYPCFLIGLGIIFFILGLLFWSVFSLVLGVLPPWLDNLLLASMPFGWALVFLNVAAESLDNFLDRDCLTKKELGSCLRWIRVPAFLVFFFVFLAIQPFRVEPLVTNLNAIILILWYCFVRLLAAAAKREVLRKRVLLSNND